MDIFSIIKLIGGVAFFLFGMNIMSGALERISGNRLEGSLKRLTSNKFKSFGIGCGMTIAMQSSSALTVMLVGLVNSGVMQFSQTISVIMGSHVGTTLTGWLLSLAGLESTNIAIQMCKPENFSPILALIGIILIMAAKSAKKKNIGYVLCGFAILMYAMEIMKDAMEPLASSPQFAGLLTAFSIPLLGVLIGALFTGVIQSSAASLGVLQAMALTGSITYSMAIPIIMGFNIGTCVTAILSSIGVSRSAKRVAVVHIMMNIIGTAVCLSIWLILDAIFDFPIADVAATPVGLALVHTIFNVATTCLLMPFTKQLEKLTMLILPDKKDGNDATSLLDDRLLKTPSVAVSESYSATVKMAKVAQSNVVMAMNQLTHFSQKDHDTMFANESKLDSYEDKISNYLVKVAACELTPSDGQKVTELLHMIGDFERIGDNALSITYTAEKMHDRQAEYMTETIKELKILCDATVEITEMTVKVFENNDAALATKIEPLEQVIDDVASRIKKRQIKRLQGGEGSTVENGITLSDTLTNIRRISDYCSNIAVCVIQTAHSTYETHSYLQHVKYTNQPEFMNDFELYRKKYNLD